MTIKEDLEQQGITVEILSQSRLLSKDETEAALYKLDRGSINDANAIYLALVIKELKNEQI